jgi:hypothetical protein
MKGIVHVDLPRTIAAASYSIPAIVNAGVDLIIGTSTNRADDPALMNEDERWRVVGIVRRSNEGTSAILNEGGSMRDLVCLCLGAAQILHEGFRNGAEIEDRLTGAVWWMRLVVVPWAEDLFGEP